MGGIHLSFLLFRATCTLIIDLMIYIDHIRPGETESQIKTNIEILMSIKGHTPTPKDSVGIDYPAWRVTFYTFWT